MAAPDLAPGSPRLSTLALAAALALAPISAGAQPPTLGGGGEAGPAEQACAGKSVDDPCSLPNGQAGVCGEGTCSRLDYSGGSPPKATEEPCVICKQGASPGTPPKLGGDGGEGGQAGADRAAPDNGNSRASGGSAGKEPPESGSRCTISDDAGRDLGLLTLFAGLAVVGLRRRRRSPRVER